MNHDPTVADLIAIAWSEKWRVAFFLLSFAVIAVAVTFSMPARWQAKTSLILPIPESAGGAGSQLVALVGVQGAANPLDMLEGVIMSRTSLVTIASKVGMKVEDVKEALKANGDLPTNQLVISAETTDAAKSKEIVTLAVGQLNFLTARLGVNVASRQKDAIERALVEKQRALDNAETRLAEYQESAKTAPDPSQPYSAATYFKALKDSELELGRVQRLLAVAKKQASTYAQIPEVNTGLPELQGIRDKLLERQTALRLAQTQFKDSSPEVRQLIREVATLRDQLGREVSKKLQAVVANVDPKVAELEAQRVFLTWQTQYLGGLAKMAPKEATQAMRYLREVQILTDVVKEMRAEFEKAKIGAEVEKVRWTVLEDPYVIEPAVNKHYGRAAGFGGAFGLFFGAFWAYWKRLVAPRPHHS